MRERRSRGFVKLCFSRRKMKWNNYILSTLKNLIDDSSSETKVRRTKFVRENDDSEIESTDKNHFVEKEIMIFKARLINQIPD